MSCTEENFITFNQIDVGYREGASLSLEKPKILVFRILNTSGVVDFWFTVLKSDDTQIVPFFGETMPKLLTLGNKVSGMLKENEYVYYAISLAKGEYKIIADFAN